MDSELARFLHEIGHLKRVKRSGWWLAGVCDPESVAEHTFRAAAVAFVLAELEGADAGKAALLALFHDAAETRVNDLHRMGKRYVDWSGVEERVGADQTRGLPKALAGRLRGLLAEARAKSSLEARVAKDADVLECLLQAREYAAEGFPTKEWVETSLREVTTRSAKRLARAILRVDPGSWWTRTASR